MKGLTSQIMAIKWQCCMPQNNGNIYCCCLWYPYTHNFINLQRKKWKENIMVQKTRNLEEKLN